MLVLVLLVLLEHFSSWFCRDTTWFSEMILISSPL